MHRRGPTHSRWPRSSHRPKNSSPIFFSSCLRPLQLFCNISPHPFSTRTPHVHTSFRPYLSPPLTRSRSVPTHTFKQVRSAFLDNLLDAATAGAPLPLPTLRRMDELYGLTNLANGEVSTELTAVPSPNPSLHKPVPVGKKKLERGHFSQSKCISPERPGRLLIEAIESSFCPGTGLYPPSRQPKSPSAFPSPPSAEWTSSTV
jgi:hypothetical protein